MATKRRAETTSGRGATVAGNAIRAGAERALAWPKPSEIERLAQAGFAPVLRWVDVANRDDKPWKAIEVLTMLDRREAKRKD